LKKLNTEEKVRVDTLSYVGFVHNDFSFNYKAMKQDQYGQILGYVSVNSINLYQVFGLVFAVSDST
jgi:hypothetical protein